MRSNTRMRIAYLILAHQRPQQLLRLAERLDHPSADCWIHLDSKCRISDYQSVLEKKQVHAIHPRIRVEWGGFSIVQAMINSLKAASHFKQGFDYYHFLSGSDYPLQSSAAFIDQLIQHAGKEFIGNRPYEESQMNIKRVMNYHFNRLRPPVKTIIERIANTILPKRSFPYPYQIRKGPQWMTLSQKAVNYLLDFIPRNRRYREFFRFVHAPDEFFFQTILYNSLFREHMINQIFHYIDWSEQKTSPKILTIKDKEQLWSSPLFFARKFDTRIDTVILDALDKKIDNVLHFS